MTLCKSQKKMIGVVGGVGPYAGLDLVGKILDQTDAVCDQDHLPVCLLSLPGEIADRTEFLLGRGSVNPALAIAQVISDLHGRGASVVGVPCNTAHAPAIFEEIVRRIPKDVTLVHMITETIRYIQRRHPFATNIGVLSTTGTFRSNVYPDALARHGLAGLQVTPEVQRDLIQPAIYDKTYGIKAHSNPVADRAKRNLREGIEILRQGGAEVLILGCTEIPLALTAAAIDGLPLVDPTRILARALIREFAPDALRPEPGDMEGQ